MNILALTLFIELLATILSSSFLPIRILPKASIHQVCSVGFSPKLARLSTDDYRSIFIKRNYFCPRTNIASELIIAIPLSPHQRNLSSDKVRFEMFEYPRNSYFRRKYACCLLSYFYKKIKFSNHKMKFT